MKSWSFFLAGDLFLFMCVRVKGCLEVPGFEPTTLDHQPNAKGMLSFLNNKLHGGLTCRRNYSKYILIAFISTLIFSNANKIDWNNFGNVAFGRFKKLTILVCKMVGGWDEAWPDPTRAYFWSAVNMRPTRLWPGYFLTQSEEIFLARREIFRIQTQIINGWPTKNWRAAKDCSDAKKKFACVQKWLF